MTFYVYMLKVYVNKRGGKWEPGHGPRARSRCGLYGKDNFFYTGMTGDLNKRIWEHKNGIRSKFLSSFDIESIKLVYASALKGNYQDAEEEEKWIKKLSTKEKIKLIEETNNQRIKKYGTASYLKEKKNDC